MINNIKSFIMIIAIAIISCENNSEKTSKNIDFNEVVSEDLVGVDEFLIVSRFGPPETKNLVDGVEVWSYGPSMDGLRESQSGDIIGVNIYIHNDKVVRVVGIKKN